MARMERAELRIRPVWFDAPDEVDEDMVEKLVRTFYARVREDRLIGPIFLRAIGEDWEAHLVRLCDFWSSVALGTGRYKGTPMHAHLKLQGLAPEHFERWLDMFRATAREVCPPASADFFIDRAERIAKSLQAALFFRVDRPSLGAGD
jgi:hemoglobin